jgi:UDP-2,4-diacetamido-2,4,6-trideoxy-beta-L-altropyranose hydrolase
MRIGIRADGGAKIGMGHIIRCLALAQAFKNDNHEAFFLSNDPPGRAKISEYGFESLTVSSSSKTAELEDIRRIIQDKNLHCLLIDSYHVDPDYFLCLKSVGKLLCYIDDLNRFVHPVDIIVNGNFAAESMGYRKYDSKQVLLLGIKYNLIREEFQNLPPVNVKPDIHRILITMGAADPVNFSSLLIREIRRDATFDHIKLEVVVGGANPLREELEHLGKEYHNINLHRNVKEMSKLMMGADWALSAGGSTLYELLACGVPVMAFIIAENQEFIVSKLAESGYIRSMDWFHHVDFEKFREELREFHFQKRKDIALNGQQLVDGHGPSRVKDAIVAYFTEKHE